MSELKDFEAHEIDWDMTPEGAVTLYLEWGNNNWLGEFKPKRHPGDATMYFVVNNWGPKPKAVLVRRLKDLAEDLAEIELPDDLAASFLENFGASKGVYAPTDDIKAWLRAQLQE
jgi:hypothetical protein